MEEKDVGPIDDWDQRSEASNGHSIHSNCTNSAHSIYNESKPVKQKLFKKFAEAFLETEGEDCTGSAFVASGRLTEAPHPGIVLTESRKVLKFPLFENDVKQILPNFQPSPFGLGEKTLVDTKIRNSYQLEPSQFEIQNRSWNEFIQNTVVDLVKQYLGIGGGRIGAKLYKLILYKKGSFFKPHRDSEKEEGMFGTLVVQLPSKYTGGQLVVNNCDKRYGHQDRNEKTIDWSTSPRESNEFHTFYSAFYCDCEHEVLEITRGVRVCLIYNLVQTDKEEKVPKLPKYKWISMWEISHWINKWKDFYTEGGEFKDEAGKPMKKSLIESYTYKQDRFEPPLKLVYIMAHKYTPESLKFKYLKSSDLSLAKHLVGNAKDWDVIFGMGFMHKVTTGLEGEDFSFDNTEYCSEVKSSYRIKNITLLSADPDTSKAFLDNKLSMRSERCEVIPERRLRLLESERESKEYLGNHGTNLKFQYSNAVFVLFPRQWVHKILGENIRRDGGLAVAQDYFLIKSSHFEEASKEVTQALKALTLEDRYLDTSSVTCEKFMALFKAVVNMKDDELLLQFLVSYKNPASYHSNLVLPVVQDLVKQKTLFSTENTKILDGIKDRGDSDSFLKFLNSLEAQNKKIDDSSEITPAVENA